MCFTFGVLTMDVIGTGLFALICSIYRGPEIMFMINVHN